MLTSTPPNYGSSRLISLQSNSFESPSSSCHLKSNTNAIYPAHTNSISIHDYSLLFTRTQFHPPHLSTYQLPLDLPPTKPARVCPVRPRPPKIHTQLSRNHCATVYMNRLAGRKGRIAAREVHVSRCQFIRLCGTSNRSVGSKGGDLLS